MRYGDFLVSIDKIKLKGKLKKGVKVHYPHFDRIEHWCNYGLPKWCECIKAVENCFALMTYRNSYSLKVKEDEEGVFYIASWYNGEYKEQRERPYNFLIEYNPNKSGERIYKEFCQKFLFVLTEICSFDLAYDIPNATTQDVIIDTKCDIMTYGKTSNKTIYIAPKEKRSGRIKVYTKSIERQAHGEEMPDTLRIEASIKCRGLDFNSINLSARVIEELTKVVEHINSVKIKEKASNSDDWKVYALSHLTPEDLEKCLSLMAQASKVKYKKLITGDNYYNLSLDIATLVNQVSNLLTSWKERLAIK